MYLYDMKFSDRFQLCKILDSNEDMWKSLAGEIGLSALDVSILERENERRHGSPTDMLLNKWGHLNATVDMLAYKLKNIKALRALEVIKHLVSKDITCLFDEDSLSLEASTNQYSFRKQSSAVSDEDLPVPYMSYEKEETEFFEKKKKSDDSHCQSIFDIRDARMKRVSFCPFVKIVMATDNFSDRLLLKKGHFGTTYKGGLNQSAVAIKVFKEMEKKVIPQNLSEEIELLTKNPHDNVAILMAISQDSSNLCLVYPYLENGSLRDRLLDEEGRRSLPWTRRHSILRDASRGLLHLHSMTPNPVVHKNIKSSNVLLGVDFSAKIGDFGFFCEDAENAMTTSKTQVPCGDACEQLTEQRAYLPDDFFRLGRKHSLQTDVHAFGTVILETCTGLDAIGMIKAKEQSLADYAVGQFSALKAEATQLKDDVVDGWDDKLWMMTFTVGILCTERKRKDRITAQQICDATEKFYGDIEMSTHILKEVHINERIEKDCSRDDSGVKDESKTMMGSQAQTDIYSSDDQKSSCFHAQSEHEELFLTSASSASKAVVDHSEDKYFSKTLCPERKPEFSKRSTFIEADDEMDISFSSKENSADFQAGQLTCTASSADMESLIKKLLQEDKERFEKLENFKKEFPGIF